MQRNNKLNLSFNQIYYIHISIYIYLLLLSKIYLLKYQDYFFEL